MAERAFIARVRELLGDPRGRVLVGPGDDAAVVRGDGVSAVSVDTVVDGVHFQLATHSPADVGHKALASALSDLAAMGAEAGEAYVALTVPESLNEAGALELVQAMAALATRTGTTIAGGDVVAGPALSVSVTVVGWATRAGRLVLRGGARPGELVGVTGELGGSGAGLLVLGGAAAPAAARAALLTRHRRPEPRLEAGAALARAGVSAMIDVSDGVAADAAHLAESSGVRIELRLADLPLADGVAQVARAARRDGAELAADAGEDYELLFTAPTASRAAVEAAVAVTWIGEVASGSGAVFRGPDGATVALDGFEHLG